MQIDRIGATSFQPQTTPAAARFDDDPRVALDWAPPPAAPVQTQAVVAPARSDNVVDLDAARTHLALSADVYNDTPSPPDGWRVAGPDDLDRLRLTPDLLERADSEFRARVYVSDEGGQTRYVVAFRGSQAGEDWLNNGQQALGLSSEHYDKALRIGQRLAAVEADVTLTGHSLGGGMASAASLTRTPSTPPACTPRRSRPPRRAGARRPISTPSTSRAIRSACCRTAATASSSEALERFCSARSAAWPPDGRATRPRLSATASPCPPPRPRTSPGGIGRPAPCTASNGSSPAWTPCDKAAERPRPADSSTPRCASSRRSFSLEF